MVEQILMGILITIVGAPVLWFLKIVFGKPILRFLKKVWGSVANRFGKLKGKDANTFHQYNESYKKRHGLLKVSCVGMERPRLLDDVYVALQFLDKKRASKHGWPTDFEKEFRGKGKSSSPSSSNEPQDGMTLANNEQYLMVIGDPGVGKSTFLRKVGLEALKGGSTSFKHECTPVFLELKRFNEDSINIESLITDELKVCGYPYPEQITNKLESGEFLILFDGLDEVRMENVDRVIRQIGDFVIRYEGNRFIASCRTPAYSGGFPQFAEKEIADFEDPQIERYIKNWFASDPNQQCWEALKATKHRSIRALAQNPLSLTFLCTVYEDQGNFPSNRARLYESILNIFLKKWTDEKQVRRDSPVRQDLDILLVKEMISEIAARNLETDRLLFRKDELINQVQEFCQRGDNTLSKFDASKILDAILIDPGLFVERASGVYSFFHRTFQEYLTANHFVSTQSIQNLVSHHLYNEQWREVFLFAAELPNKADHLLKAMEVEVVKSINTEGFKTLFRWAERITDITDDRYNGIAKRAIAINQYITLRLLNEIHEMVKEGVKFDPYLDLYRYLNRYFNFNRYFNRYFRLERYRDFYRDFHFDINRNRNLYIHLRRHLSDNAHPYGNLYRYLDLYHELYRHRYRDIHHNLYIHFYLDQDLYQYTDADYYSSVPSQYVDQFDQELEIQIVLIDRIEQAKIFTGVNLQRIVRRFNEQREFIKVARAGKPSIPSEKSIHDTWLSILGITNDMLAISHEELKNYVQYLRAMELIVACKEAAESVSPKIWRRIEDGFLTVDAEESED